MPKKDIEIFFWKKWSEKKDKKILMFQPNIVYKIPYEKIPDNPDAPLAPLVNLTLKNPEFPEEIQECLAIIDTGSDITLVPQLIIASLKFFRTSGRFRYFLPPEGAGGEIVGDTSHLLQLSFDGINFFWVDVWRRLGSENLVLIGRDLLNDGFIVKFDGINFITTIECYLNFE